VATLEHDVAATEEVIERECDEIRQHRVAIAEAEAEKIRIADAEVDGTIDAKAASKQLGEAEAKARRRLCRSSVPCWKTSSEMEPGRSLARGIRASSRRTGTTRTSRPNARSSSSRTGSSGLSSFRLPSSSATSTHCSPMIAKTTSDASIADSILCFQFCPSGIAPRSTSMKSSLSTRPLSIDWASARAAQRSAPRR
jgi:hypothetical protein